MNKSDNHKKRGEQRSGDVYLTKFCSAGQTEKKDCVAPYFFSPINDIQLDLGAICTTNEEHSMHKNTKFSCLLEPGKMEKQMSLTFGNTNLRSNSRFLQHKSQASRVMTSAKKKSSSLSSSMLVLLAQEKDDYLKKNSLEKFETYKTTTTNCSSHNKKDNITSVEMMRKEDIFKHSSNEEKELGQSSFIEKNPVLRAGDYSCLSPLKRRGGNNDNGKKEEEEQSGESGEERKKKGGGEKGAIKDTNKTGGEEGHEKQRHVIDQAKNLSGMSIAKDELENVKFTASHNFLCSSNVKTKGLQSRSRHYLHGTKSLEKGFSFLTNTDDFLHLSTYSSTDREGIPHGRSERVQSLPQEMPVVHEFIDTQASWRTNQYAWKRNSSICVDDLFEPSTNAKLVCSTLLAGDCSFSSSESQLSLPQFTYFTEKPRVSEYDDEADLSLSAVCLDVATCGHSGLQSADNESGVITAMNSSIQIHGLRNTIFNVLKTPSETYYRSQRLLDGATSAVPLRRSLPVVNNPLEFTVCSDVLQASSLSKSICEKENNKNNNGESVFDIDDELCNDGCGSIGIFEFGSLCRFMEKNTDEVKRDNLSTTETKVMSFPFKESDEHNLQNDIKGRESFDPAIPSTKKQSLLPPLPLRWTTLSSSSLSSLETHILPQQKQKQRQHKQKLKLSLSSSLSFCGAVDVLNFNNRPTPENDGDNSTHDIAAVASGNTANTFQMSTFKGTTSF